VAESDYIPPVCVREAQNVQCFYLFCLGVNNLYVWGQQKIKLWKRSLFCISWPSLAWCYRPGQAERWLAWWFPWKSQDNMASLYFWASWGWARKFRSVSSSLFRYP